SRHVLSSGGGRGQRDDWAVRQPVDHVDAPGATLTSAHLPRPATGVWARLRAGQHLHRRNPRYQPGSEFPEGLGARPGHRVTPSARPAARRRWISPIAAAHPSGSRPSRYISIDRASSRVSESTKRIASAVGKKRGESAMMVVNLFPFTGRWAWPVPSAGPTVVFTPPSSGRPVHAPTPRPGAACTP